MKLNVAWMKEQLRFIKTKRFSGKSGLWTFVIALVVFGFLGLSLRKDWGTVLAFHWQLHWGDLVMMMVMHTLALGTMYLAWHFTMQRLVNQSQWKLNFRIFSLSILARRIPLPIWYVGSRVVMYRENQVPTTLVLTATVLEIALIALSGVICYFLLLPWYTNLQSNIWWILAAIAGILVFFMILRPAFFIDLINMVLRRIKKPAISVTISRLDLLTWTTLYLATWFLDGMGLYFTVAAFLPTPPPVPSVIGISTISAMIALATMALPAGFGIKEITMGALLGIWMPVSAGIILSILYRFLQTSIEAVWAFIGQRVTNETAKTVQ